MSEDVVIVCTRHSQLALENGVSGASLDSCSECGVQIVVSPSSRSLAKRHGARLLCDDCALALALALGDALDQQARVEPLNLEQYAELVQTLGPSAAARIDQWVSQFLAAIREGMRRRGT